jgi:hypothetical protein
MTFKKLSCELRTHDQIWKRKPMSSVADPGCLSRILDLGINFELAKKKIWANLQRIIELSTQKIVIKFPKI